MTETAYTRAMRRAQHDSYAPYIVRPAIRGDIVDRAFEPIGRFFTYAALAFVVSIVLIGVARWLLNL